MQHQMRYSFVLAILASICCAVYAVSSCNVVTQKILEAKAVSGTNLNILSRVPGNVHFQTGSTTNVTFVVQISTSLDRADPVSLSLSHVDGLSLFIDANTQEISAATSRQSLSTLLLNLTLATLLPSMLFINKASLRLVFAVLLLCSLAVRVNTKEESCIRADVHIYVPEQFAFGQVSVSLAGDSQVYCPNDCSASGVCDQLTGQCTCNVGFAGQDCSVVSMQIESEEDDVKRSVMDAEVTVRPTALSTIQANPYRGFYNWLGMDYTVISQSVGPYKDSYTRYAWAEIETSQGVYSWTAIDNELTKAAANGGKFGFRIMLLDTYSKGVGLPNYVFQSQGGALNCDADGDGALDTYVPNWEDTFMRQRAQALWTALANRYSNDARLGWIDIGMIGDYGEWHPSSVCTNDVEASLATKQAYIDIVVNAFPNNKYFTINTNDDDGICYALQKSQNVGIRNDVFSEIWNWDNSRFWPLGQYRYRTAPSFAEFTASGDPTTYNFAEAQREARDYHFSTIGNGNIPYTSSGYSAQQLADLAQLGKIIGFVAKVNSVQLSSHVDQDNCMVVGLNMSNTGTSRIYDDWNTVIELRPTCAKYVGCWTDVSTSRDLTGSLTTSASMTIDSCSSTCKSAGYKYAGLQSGNTCTCGNSYGKYAKQAETQCVTACVGDATQRCGGTLRNSVYDVSACTGSFVTSTTTYRSPNVMEITNVFPDLASYTYTNSFQLSSTAVPVGLYKAYLTVLDRKGYRPPLAFAITGRDSNGRYPLGVSVLVTNTSTPGVTITCPTTTPIFNQPLYPVSSYRYQQTAGEYYIFRDNFAVGWSVDRPYQITSALKFKESTSLKITSFTDTWYTINFFACDLDVSKYQTVRFSVYAEQAVSGLQLQMYKGQWTSSLPAVWLGSLAAGQWKTFTIQMSQFQLSTKVTWIVLAVQQPAQTNAVYIDDFAFATTNIQYIYRDTLCSGCTVSTISATTWTTETTIVNSESNSMKFSAITDTWFHIDTTGISVSPSWQYLHLEVYAEKDVYLAQVQLYSGTWNSNIPAVVIPITPGKWNTFNIPVSQFSISTPATLLAIQLGQNSGQTNNYYVDNVVFSNDGTL